MTPDRDSLLHELFDRDAPPEAAQRLLTGSEVALLFQVSARTVSVWAKKGLLPTVRTPGGRLRYPTEPVLRLLSGEHDT